MFTCAKSDQLGDRLELDLPALPLPCLGLLPPSWGPSPLSIFSLVIAVMSGHYKLCLNRFYSVETDVNCR
jgi:hypothetical protein